MSSELYLRPHRPIMRVRETRYGDWKLHGPYCHKCSVKHHARVPWPCRRNDADLAHRG